MQKTVIITGASRGIGEAIARCFADEGGWNIVICSGKSPEALSALARELEKNPRTACLALTGDVADSVFISRLFAEAEAAFGGVDVLINNAGIAQFGLIQDTSEEEFDRLLAVDLKSVFLTTRASIPLMLRKHAGAIVNISSVFGSVGASCEAVYSAAKGGVNAFTRAAARELSPSGIRVNALACGAIDTAMNSRLSEEEAAILREDIPLGRMGSPEEAARMVFDLAVRHTYMTGQVVTMDGGWM